MSEEQKRLLEKQLWAVANILRGKMNADEYRNYILGFIFYKYLSEKLERYINEKLLNREGFTFADIKEDTKQGKAILNEVKKACVIHLGFFLKPSSLFDYLVKKGNGEIEGQDTFILEDLKNVLNAIEQTSMGTASEDDFKGLFDDVVLTSPKLGKTEHKKNEVIVEVLSKLSEIDFKLEDSKSDLLGDAYEYLIGEFAAGAGKKGGEFYTPAQVSRLLAMIVTDGKKRIKSVYDPTCGSGSLLLRIGDYTNVSMYLGQELNPTTYNLARMNMILHGVHFDNFSIRQGDTLVDDMHLDLQAEAVVANPPFSAKWKGDSDPVLAADERFTQYGRLAPKGAADFAFVTHMLYHLADNGVMAVVLPHGALFRSGAEEHIRKYIIEKQNYLDAVIGLPADLFYGTGIPATVLVFKKCRKDNEDILFIDASKEFERGKSQTRLTGENIEKIFSTYKERKEIERYSHKATIEEVRENEYNLNIPRYVDTFEEELEIDIKQISQDFKEVYKKEKILHDKISKFCDELKIDKPF
ncbi:MAG: Type I restriction-modification system, M subunit [Candidatus Shapirobacteria bacterium GW2011_GWE1_38_10]|uniref:site-specific DNA-methyltransferase (adenine-specific) n=1 Tax=Candidatus Shapirobacteria bacterium GW2011_GWE1_38_10 TaxID=1618488 RepID=A0A0G0LC88_9BACT|nr:MAG: Type I restriction-modification system, M subunit [Candidatus Shapirobacteria bacterium GW2011_GWF2_37_20]KKQ50256.1 MAG: Type I restriction-modification system, M subunit [Candidatus Shapirobacteria bacterium GW2011_GWE1_38_10]KKQ64790.1 MAG: Type I restriction-modification system, M subunit [Candidatus Shapirobacteria bacterium GW2011_GWF1_38_23]HBP50809.1 type I restriction-modification system subunit M [Candidatus Shapirobacteria bacterium]